MKLKAGNNLRSEEKLRNKFGEDEQKHWEELYGMQGKTSAQRDRYDADGCIGERRMAGAANGDRNGEQASGADDEGFSEPPARVTSYFSRLYIKMQSDPEAREALAGMGQALNGLQQDGGQNRDFVWFVIAGRFDDRSLRSRPDLRGVLDGVNSIISPPPGDDVAPMKLKEWLYNAKSQFNIKVRRWQRSGNGDSESFYKHLRKKYNGDFTGMFMVMEGSMRVRHMAVKDT